MPARKDRDASITIRFAEKRYGPGVDLEKLFPIRLVINWLDAHSDCYLIGLEQPGAIWTQHYEIAAILRDEAKIADDLKDKLHRYVDEHLDSPLIGEELRRTISCKYHDNIKLRFGYCSKESVAHSKGVSPEFLTECKEVYESGKKCEKKIPVSRSRLLPLIREMYEILSGDLACDSLKHDQYYRLDATKQFNVLWKMLIIKGYDLTCIAPSNKREIIDNFYEYIVGHSEGLTEYLGLIK